jgi:autotransporter translocation and assembly factor TamB
MALTRIVRWLAIALLVCLGLVVVAMVAATTPWFKDQVRGLIVTRVGGLIEGELAIRDLTGSLFGHVTLHDIVVRQHGQPTIQVGQASVQYDIVQLALGRFSIDEVAIREPDMRLIEHEAGWNITQLVRPRERQPGSAAWSVDVRRLVIVNGRLLVEPLGGRAYALADLNLEGGLSYMSPTLDLSVEELSARETRSGLHLTRLSGEFASGGGEIHARNLFVSTPASTMRGHVAYRGGGRDAEVDAALELPQVTPAEFAAFLPVDVPPALTLRGQLSAAGALDALRVAWSLESSAGATDGRMALRLGRPDAIGLDGTAGVERVDLAALTGQARLASRLTARIDARGTIDREAPAASDLTFAVRAPEIAAMGYAAQAFAASGRLASRTLHIDGEGRAYGAHAIFDAVVTRVDDTSARQVTASGRVRGLDVNALPPALRAPEIPTNISGQYAIEWGGTRWRAEMTADASQIREATVAAGTHFVVESAPGRFTATVDGSVAGVGAGLLRLPEGRSADLGGRIRARVSLPGIGGPIPLDAVDADVAADLSGSTLDGVRLDTAEIDATLAGGTATIRRLDLQAPDVSLSANGQLALAGEGPPSDLTVTAGLTDLSRLSMVGVEGLGGALHLEGLVTGPPDALSAAGKFSAHQLRHDNNIDALAVNGTFEAAVPDGQWAQLTADVTMESAFLTLRGYDVQRLTLTSRYQAGRIDLAGRIEQTERAIDLDGTLVTHLDHREVHVRQLTLSAEGSPWQLGGPGEAVINYGGETVRIDGLVFVRDAERIEASGVLAFSGDEPSDLRLRFQDVQVGDLYLMAFGTSGVTGVAGGEFRVGGILPKVDVTGGIEVIGGQVGQVAYTRAAADVAFRDRRLTLDARIDEPNGSTFTVAGTVPVSAGAGALDVRVRSPGVSLGLMQAFTSHLAHLQGQAAVDLHATGPLDNPTLNGTVAITGGGFAVTATGVTYQNLNADIAFEGRRATTRHFTVTDDDGHVLTVTAGADVFSGGRARAFDVSIQGESLQVVENELGDVEITLDLRARGDIGAPVITGRIALDQGRLEVDEVLRRVRETRSGAPAELRAGLPSGRPDAMAPTPAGAVETVGIPDAEPPVEAPAPDTGIFARTRMDLDIVIPDALVLRGQDVRAGAGSMALGNLNITIGGTLDVGKNPGAEAVLQGSLGVVRGFYEFQGRRFEVTRGSSVSFRGPDPANPALNVTGERSVQGVIARVQVTGSLRRPRLQLSSDPPLDEGDVLALIVFNQPINQLGEAEQVDLLDRAGALATGALANSLSESIGEALDVDLFEIRAPGGDAAGELTLGRQVNDRLFIGFQQEFAGGEASRLQLEYQLTDALRILTSVAQGVERAKRSRNQDTAGIDLIYQVRY